MAITIKTVRAKNGKVVREYEKVTNPKKVEAYKKVIAKVWDEPYTKPKKKKKGKKLRIAKMVSKAVFKQPKRRTILDF